MECAETVMESSGYEFGWYSVWAQPDSPGLRSAMAHLRSLYQGPAFEPHVTVLGAQKLSLQQATLSLRAACRVLPPFSCRLTRPSCGNTYYQCVYMLVDPSAEVLGANQLVQNIFEAQPSSHVYTPHVSLLYGDLSAENREKARVLVEENYGHELCDTEFRISSLCLYSTDTNDRALTTWKKVIDVPLEGVPQQ